MLVSKRCLSTRALCWFPVVVVSIYRLYCENSKGRRAPSLPSTRLLRPQLTLFRDASAEISISVCALNHTYYDYLSIYLPTYLQELW